jgi:hypothetical protein
MKEDKYFVYDPMYHQFDTYATVEEQMKAAEDVISDCIEDNGEWGGDVTEVVCGVITHQATEHNKKLRPKNLNEGYDEEGQFWPDNIEYICDFRMEEIPEGQTGEQE